MRAVVQRVLKATVLVKSSVVGSIDGGLVVYLGIASGDTHIDADYIAHKISRLRIFQDDDGKMSLSVKEIAGQVLLISQFTLLGDVRRGTRPSFSAAEVPDRAQVLYQRVYESIRASGITVETGIFGASMVVESTGAGPVTILVDSKRLF